MEQYCAEHPGTFLFNRMLYEDQTARPATIEFGIRREDAFWVETFENSSCPE